MTSERTKAMDDLIAQDADLIDNPLVAAVRELLTDDSMEHLDTFTHNLVQAFNRHGLKVVSTDYLDNLNDTVRGLRLDICETQAREIERLSYALGCIANEDWKDMTVELARDTARAALVDSHDQ